MAVEVFLSALLPVIIDKLISAAIHPHCAPFGSAGRLRKLKWISSAIKDAEERQTASIAIKNWVSALKDVSYEAEDVLDDFEFEARRKQISLNQGNFARKVLFYSSFNKTRFCLRRRLNGIIEKMEDLADQINKFKLQLVSEVPQIFYGRPQTHSYVDEETVIGREKDKEDIVSFLINHDVSNNKNIAVLPIVAMGGMGKTTLSQLVFRDHRVEDYFHLRLWVCVSDADFDISRLVRLIIEAANKNACELSNMEVLQDQLRGIISGKRYLIVLDDVWNENPIQWEGLKTLLDCGGEGSSILVSSRSMKAAEMVATHTIYYLKQLPEKDSWELFRRRAFAEEAEELASLVEIGKDIIKRCGGLPLALNTLGSILRHNNDEEEWKDVLDSELWNMQDANDNILPALRLSYNYLPSHSKQCFAFCAIYPKNYEMEKDTLIQLWMANGFIRGNLEAKGSYIFDELVWRSFFQDVVEEDDGRVTCKMHDLMHDLAQSITENECLNFVNISKWEDIPLTAMHLRIQSLPELKSPCKQPMPQKLRTIVLPLHALNKQKSPVELPVNNLSNLRVLSLPSIICGKSESIKHLRHLRMLDLSHSKIKKLPEDICSLYHFKL